MRTLVITPSDQRAGLEIEKEYNPMLEKNVVNFYTPVRSLRPVLIVDVDDISFLLTALKTLVEG